MITLRPYQREALSSAIRSLQTHRSTLIVMPTGTGKTVVFVELARLARRGRVLLLAHRDELVVQATDKVRAQLGIEPGIEKAEQHCGEEQVVVGSVQTLHAKRLRKLPSEAFSLLVIDEAHHATARTYRRIIDHFEAAKIVGVTATPDRADRKRLGDVFESVAYEYSIAEAIAEEWLVEPSLWRVHIDSIDLSGVKKSSGDLVQSALEVAVAKGLHAAAKVLLERAGDRLTLCYTPGVASAHDLARVLSAQRPGCAHALDGSTLTDERRDLLARHERGDYQFLVNCMVLTEGYDSPAVSCVGLLRPTCSRSLYAQMMGRGLRLHPGKVDCLVLDFTDSSGKHDLVGPEDILGGDPDVAKAAKEHGDACGPEPIRVTELLAKAKAEVAYRLERVRREKRRRKKKLVVPETFAGWVDLTLPDGSSQATERQQAAIERFGIDGEGISRTAASALLDELVSRAKGGLCTARQMRFLDRQRRLNPRMSREQASQEIDFVISMRGRSPRAPRERI